jgi:hypothetical protein
LISKVWGDGIYFFWVSLTSEQANADAVVTIRMKGSHGYLSAIDRPLLIFYGVMCGVYSLYAIFWLIISACYWRDLLRVQFWIGGVIFLGLLEKAFFLSEYQTINATGQSVRGAVIFAEFVSCLKRTLARLLVMVVCIGYGIVKPRLGVALRKVVVLGVLYFIFSMVEGMDRVLKPRFFITKRDLWAVLPLALTDATIFVVTFSYLVQTIRQMRIRRNVAKFNLYRHFSNLLIIIICASIVFMAWSIYSHKWTSCLENWQDMWVDNTFWHILFSSILLVIMWLWRPSKNSIRYAYSPVLDADQEGLLSDDEVDANEEEINMENFSSGDVRRINTQKTNDKNSKQGNSAEDELKWIDEHIPTTAVESAYPALDSEEENENNKLTESKME